MKKNYLSRVRDYVTRDHMRRREEAYLNKSVSTADLERREREIEAGLFRQNRW